MLNTPVTSQMSTNFTQPPHFFYKLLVGTISGRSQAWSRCCSVPRRCAPRAAGAPARCGERPAADTSSGLAGPAEVVMPSVMSVGRDRGRGQARRRLEHSVEHLTVVLCDVL